MLPCIYCLLIVEVQLIGRVGFLHRLMSGEVDLKDWLSELGAATEGSGKTSAGLSGRMQTVSKLCHRSSSRIEAVGLPWSKAVECQLPRH